MTYTYTILEVSPAAYKEIAGKLLDAGYGNAFHEEGEYGVDVIDMHGLAIAPETTDFEAKYRCGCTWLGKTPGKGDPSAVYLNLPKCPDGKIRVEDSALCPKCKLLP